MMMGGWWLMVLLPMVVVALVAWALLASGRAWWARQDQDAMQLSALPIPEERFARGEIDREEVERRRESLSRHSTPASKLATRREVAMLRRLVGVAALTAALVVGAAVPALAQDVTPGGGNDFGQHVAGMAPEHAIAHGADFGACVSAMAQGLACPHLHP